MNRREMLKGLGLSLGALAITPSVASLLNSCASEEKLTWSPAFFTKQQVPLLNKVVDIILPKTDGLPGATEVNVPQFIDKFIAEVFDSETKEISKKGFESFGNLFLKDKNKVDFSAVKIEAIEAEIAKILTKSKEEHEATMRALGEALQNETDIPEEVLNYVTIDNIRGLSIFAYKSSEYIAEEVLAYYPVPGRQKGCVSVEEATKGKAYSL